MRTGDGGGLRIGVLEPHLQRYGGIRRMVEFANRLVDRGHHVTFYLPRTASLRCTWMACRAEVKFIHDGMDDSLDILIFNDETQWFLLDRFPKARKTVFYALHYAALYEKQSSWEALRAPVDLQLANSGWTADMIEAETGHRPEVLLSGIDQTLFRPTGDPKRYPILCTGGSDRVWKGTQTVREAARLIGLRAEEYAHKDLEQPALAREYNAAEIFAVGSWFEGFGQPGLEALACGVPLVTTDNGGCREYAVDGETALVVPPRDAPAMAEAFRRLRESPALASELAANGLDLVRREFDWDRRTDDLELVLDGLAAGVAPAAPPPRRPEPPDQPTLSVIVLAWENISFTQSCVESIRRNTDVPYELIIVDNGSRPEAASYAEHAADLAILNTTNRGFAVGMNQGLAAASGDFVAFCNNDIRVPEQWASRLVETASNKANGGIVVPALTAAGNPVTVRSSTDDSVSVIPPFSPPPSAVVYLMDSEVARGLDGWSEAYHLASGEDIDLAFKVWVNDLDIIFDQRVLVDHVGKATARLLGDWRSLWDQNRELFVETWQRPDLEIPRLESCDPARFDRNRAIAAATAHWMQIGFDSDQGRLGIRLRWTRLRQRVEGLARRTVLSLEDAAPPRIARTIRRLH